jgi:hypothetical protein
VSVRPQRDNDAQPNYREEPKRERSDKLTDDEKEIGREGVSACRETLRTLEERKSA